MSLASAIRSLPDDRASRSAVRSVVAFISEHPGEALPTRRIAAATGVEAVEVESVVGALKRGFVVDCGSDSGACRYQPTPVLSAEVDRFLHSSARSHDRFRSNVDRFRGGYGRGR
jgi:hypothetical protein